VGGVGLGMEVEQRLRGEEGVERHIFGHSRETDWALGGAALGLTVALVEFIANSVVEVASVASRPIRLRRIQGVKFSATFKPFKQALEPLKQAFKPLKQAFKPQPDLQSPSCSSQQPLWQVQV